jgi:hypothetical protein
MSTDPRSSAKARVDGLVTTLRAHADQSAVRGLIEECEALSRAIGAFHFEGIRFRMFNVDRVLSRGSLSLPPETAAAFADVRRDLEAAGFYTRSHQAPPANPSKASGQ